MQIIFFEKPGCINNTRQKKLLRQAGHTVVAINLLAENWAEKNQELRAFFGDRPVREWFNYSAPLIKNGTLDPDKLSGEQALSLMIADPLLIRRPLMQIGQHRLAGFDEGEIEKLSGSPIEHSQQELEQCPKQQQNHTNHG